MGEKNELKSRLQDARRFANAMPISKAMVGGYDKQSVIDNVRVLSEMYEKYIALITDEYEKKLFDQKNELLERNAKIEELDGRLNMLAANVISYGEEHDDDALQEFETRVKELEEKLREADLSLDEMNKRLEESNDYIETLKNAPEFRQKEMLDQKMLECEEQTSLVVRVMVEARKTADRIIESARLEAEKINSELAERQQTAEAEYQKALDKLDRSKDGWQSTLDAILNELSELRENVGEMKAYIDEC